MSGSRRIAGTLILASPKELIGSGYQAPRHQECAVGMFLTCKTDAPYPNGLLSTSPFPPQCPASSKSYILTRVLPPSLETQDSLPCHLGIRGTLTTRSVAYSSPNWHKTSFSEAYETKNLPQRPKLSSDPLPCCLSVVITIL